MSNAVFGLATSGSQAQRIVERMRGVGISDNDISVLYPDSAGTHGLAHDKETKAPEGAMAGAGTGGAVGVALGWLVGVGSLAIPGVGPFIAAGPILAALSGAAVGAAVGGMAGGLVGLGIPEYEAKMFEGKLRDGRILISAHIEDSKQRGLATDILKEEGAEDIGTSKEVETKDAKKEAHQH